jgi:endonuclease-3
MPSELSKKRALNQFKELKKHSNIAKSSGMKLAAESWRKDWQTIISILMSARTRDEVTILTAAKLFKKYSSLEKLSKAKLAEIEKTIRSVNFYKNKSKNVLALSKKIKSDYKGKIPIDFEELVKLPGVGRKTANVFLSEKGKSEIGIDTHVTYISNKLGWTSHKTQEKIETDLKNLFPKKYWVDVNSTLVRFGKTHTSRKKKDEILEEIKKVE